MSSAAKRTESEILQAQEAEQAAWQQRKVEEEQERARMRAQVKKRSSKARRSRRSQVKKRNSSRRSNSTSSNMGMIDEEDGVFEEDL